MKSLSDKNGPSFDAMYITQMTEAHDKAIALFNAEQSSGIAPVAAFAGKTLPTLQMHRQMLSTLQTSAHAANLMQQSID